MKHTLPAAALLLAAGLLTACSSTSPRAIRADVTPYMDSLARNTELDKNQYARVIDHNTRSAWDDLARILLIDETSRLNYITVP